MAAAAGPEARIPAEQAPTPLTASAPRPEPPVRLLRHGNGAPALRLGLGPGHRPVGAIRQLQHLFNSASFWAAGRSQPQLRRMLRGSEAAVSAWDGQTLVGFARATSDTLFRAVVWDVVVAEGYQGVGLGRRLVEELLRTPALARAERVYLMTTNSQGFYERLGFKANSQQSLMMVERRP